MFNKIKINNFQSHRESVLEFHEGVNVITGSSDCGKSAIIRALKWLVWNRPGGDGFRSHWGGDTVTKLYLKDDIITRKKGKNNEYRLTTDGVQSLFEAFKTDVPDEIKYALSLSEINLQQQLDNPFLLTETPGFVADHFNKVARIDKINLTEKNINSAIRSINSDIEKSKKDIEKYEQELGEFPDLETIEMDLEVLEGLEKERNRLSKGKSNLSNLIQYIDDVNDKIEEESGLIPLEKEVDYLLTQIKERDKVDSNCFQLGNLIEDLEMIDYKTNQYNEEIQWEGIVDSILTKIDENDVILVDLRALTNLVDKIHASDKKLLKTQENVVKMEKQFKKEIGDVCPLCGSKLK